MSKKNEKQIRSSNKSTKNNNFILCPVCKKGDRIAISQLITTVRRNYVFWINFNKKIHTDMSYYLWCPYCGDKSDEFDNVKEFEDLIKSELLLKDISPSVSSSNNIEGSSSNTMDNNGMSLGLEVKKSKDNRYYVSMFCSYNHQRLMTSEMYKKEEYAKKVKTNIMNHLQKHYESKDKSYSPCLSTAIYKSKDGKHFVSLSCIDSDEKLLTSQMYKQKRSANNLKNKIDKYLCESCQL